MAVMNIRPQHIDPRPLPRSLAEFDPYTWAKHGVTHDEDRMREAMMDVSPATSAPRMPRNFSDEYCEERPTKERSAFNREIVYRCIWKNPGAKKIEIQNLCRLQKETVKNALCTLRNHGRIYSTGANQRTQWWIKDAGE